jgi:thiol-disulfide isomerase/thioredoxin
MTGEPTTPPDEAKPVAGQPDARGWRDPRRLGLVLAAAAVVAVVAFAAPRDAGDGYGPVAQVEPVAGDGARLATGPEIGKLAPNFRLRTGDGQEVMLSDLRGRPVFLNFWATWCIFCVTEMPAMQRLADRYGEQVVVVGVNVGEDAETVRRFGSETGIRYQLLLDRERTVTKAFQARAMPTSLFLDAGGVVRGVKYGVLTPPEMEAMLDPLLAPAGD